jgi:hypothetical protein
MKADVRPHFLIPVVASISLVIVSIITIHYIARLLNGEPDVTKYAWFSAASCLYLFFCLLFFTLLPRTIKLLLSIYFYSLPTALIFTQSTQSPTVFILFGFFIIFCTTTYGLATILYSVCLSIFTLFCLHVITHDHHNLPTTSYFDLALQCTLIAFIAYIRWRVVSEFNRNYGVLKHRLDTVSSHLHHTRNRQISETIKELTTLYQFADAGRKSVAVLHNLANHLTLISTASRKRPLPTKKLNRLISQAYTSLQPTSRLPFQPFVLLAEECIPSLKDVAGFYKIAIESTMTSRAKHHTVFGDPLQLSLTITILVHNAIQAYRDAPHEKKIVSIDHDSSDGEYHITIVDSAGGIPSDLRDSLFDLHTSSDSGHGIGLFTASQIVRRHFNGTLHHTSEDTKTIFKLSIPLEMNEESANPSRLLAIPE